MPDLTLSNHGTVWLLRALTDAGQDWLDANVTTEETVTIGPSIAVQPRYVAAWGSPARRS